MRGLIKNICIRRFIFIGLLLVCNLFIFKTTGNTALTSAVTDLTLPNQGVFMPSGPVAYLKLNITATGTSYDVVDTIYVNIRPSGTSSINSDYFDTIYLFGPAGLLDAISVSDAGKLFLELNADSYEIFDGSFDFYIVLEVNETMPHAKKFTVGITAYKGLLTQPRPISGVTNTITARKTIKNVVPAHFVVGQYSKPFAVFALDLANGSQPPSALDISNTGRSYLKQMIIHVHTLKGNFRIGKNEMNSNLSTLEDIASRRGIQLWKDVDLNGKFDYNNDSQVGLTSFNIDIEYNDGSVPYDTIILNILSSGGALPVQSKGSTFWLVFRTGKGWGPEPGKLGYGDAFMCTMAQVVVRNNYKNDVSDTWWGAGGGILPFDPNFPIVNSKKATAPIYTVVGPVMANSYYPHTTLELSASYDFEDKAGNPGTLTTTFRTPGKEVISHYGYDWLSDIMLDPLSPTYKKANYQHANHGRSGLDYRILSFQMTGGYQYLDKPGSLYEGNTNDERLEQFQLVFHHNGNFDSSYLLQITNDYLSGVSIYRTAPEIDDLTTTNIHDDLLMQIAGYRWQKSALADTLTIDFQEGIRLRRNDAIRYDVGGGSTDLDDADVDEADIDEDDEGISTTVKTYATPNALGRDFDYYVVIRPSVNVKSGDTFFVSIPAGGFKFTHGQSIDEVTWRSDTFIMNYPCEFVDLVPQGGKIIGRTSAPEPAVGINIWNTGDTALFKGIGFYIESVNGYSFNRDDLAELLTGDTTAGGITIWKDMIGGVTGIFDDKDTVLAIKRIDWRGGEDGKRHYVWVELEDGDTIPYNDNGLDNGVDYYIAFRTSATASNDDSFRVWIMRLNINSPFVEGLMYEKESGDTGTIFVTQADRERHRFLYDTGTDEDGREGPIFVTNAFTIKGLTSLSYFNLTQIGERIDVLNTPKAVIGIDLYAKGVMTIDGVTVRILSEDALFDPNVSLRALYEDNSSGIAIYKDNPESGIRGVFDSADAFVKLSGLPEWSMISPGYYETSLNFFTPQTVPNTNTGDDSGAEYFVVIQTSDKAMYQENFRIEMPVGAIKSNVRNEGNKFVTNKINVVMPTLLTNLMTNSNIEYSDTVVLFGINSFDTTTTADANQYLKKLTLQFQNVNDFKLADILTLTDSSATSGIAVYRDNKYAGAINSFDIDYDTPLKFANTPQWSGAGIFEVNLQFEPSTTTEIPSYDAGVDLGNEFFVVIRTSDQISNGSKFIVRIPENGIEFTDEVSKKTIATDTITTKYIYATLSKLTTAAPQQFFTPGDTIALIGLNMNDDNGSDKISELKIKLYNSGSDSDFNPSIHLIQAPKYPVYMRNVKTGEVYSATVEWPENESDTFMSTARLRFNPGVDVPNNDLNENAGIDFEIIVATDTKIVFGIDFYATLSTIDIKGDRKITIRNVSSDTVTARPYTKLIDYSFEPGVLLGPSTTNNNETALIGIQLSDKGKDLYLKNLTVTFMNVGDDRHFDPTTDVLALSDTYMSGIGIWRESGDTIGWDGRIANWTVGCDTFIKPVAIPIWSGANEKSITFDFNGSLSDTGISDELTDTGIFYLVIRLGKDVRHNADFKIRVDINNIVYDAPQFNTTFSNGQSLVSAYPFIVDAQAPQFVSTTLDKTSYKKGDTITATIVFSNYTEEDTIVISVDMSQFDTLFSADSVIINDNFDGSFTAKYRIRSDSDGNTRVGGNYNIFVSAVDKIGNVSDTGVFPNAAKGTARLDVVGPTWLYTNITDSRVVYPNYKPGYRVYYYRNGDIIKLRVRWQSNESDTDIINVLPNFSYFDSEFNAENVMVSRNLTGYSDISYQFSTTNSFVNARSGTIPIIVSDVAFDTYNMTDTLWIIVDNEAPKIDTNNVTIYANNNPDNTKTFFKNGDIINMIFGVDEAIDSRYTVIDFSAIDSKFDSALVSAIYDAGSNNYTVSYTISSDNARRDNKNLAIILTFKDLAGNIGSDSIFISLDNTKPIANIRLPLALQVFNDSVINVIGRSEDVDARGDIEGRQASEIKEIRIKVEADTKLSDTTFVADTIWYNNVLALNRADTVTSGQLDWMQWQYYLVAHETANIRISVNAIDNAGNQSGFSDSIIIKYRPHASDVQPPQISLMNVTPNPFSPDNDGIKDYAVLEYSLNKSVATALLQIYDYNNALVRVITQYGQNAGANQIIWNGKNDNGNVVAEGLYNLVLTVTDYNENVSTHNVKARVDITAPYITNIQTEPNPFSPNGDGIKDEISISFTVANLDASQTVAKLRLIKNIDENFFWYRFDEGPFSMSIPSELIIVSKNYLRQTVELNITGEDEYGFEKTSNFVSFPQGTNPNEIGEVPGGKFSKIVKYEPKVSGGGDLFDYSFDVKTKVGKAVAQILDSSGKVIKVIKDFQPAFTGNGNYIIRWDGKEAAGKDGIYVCRIIVEDEIGNEAFKDVQIVISTDELDVGSDTVAPSTISPNGDNINDNCKISFITSKASQISVNIVRKGAQSDVVLRALVADSTLQVAGLKEYVWDGKNDAGATVLAGEYIIKISVFDPVSKKTVKRELTVVVEYAPKITITDPGVASTIKNVANIQFAGTAFDGLNGKNISSFVIIVDERIGETLQSYRRLTLTPAQVNYNTLTGAWLYEYTDAGILNTEKTFVFNIEITDSYGIKSVSEAREVKFILKNYAQLEIIPRDAEGAPLNMINNNLDFEGNVIPLLSFTNVGAEDIISKIEIYRNNELFITRTVSNNILPGISNFTLDPLSDSNIIYAYAYNHLGVRSEKSNEIYITIIVPEGEIALGIVGSNSTKPVFNPNIGQELEIRLPSIGVALAPKYAAAANNSVKLEIYSMSGQKLFSQDKEVVTQNGKRSIKWNGKNYAGVVLKNGVYIIKVLDKVFPIAIVK